MPIMEIRDGIAIMNSDRLGGVTGFQLDNNGFGIYQKKINVQRKLRHKLEHCDFYIDAFGNGYTKCTFYLTPQPLIYSDMIDITGGGPDGDRGIVPAYNENVLYKAQWFQRDGPFGAFNNEFPNNFLSSRPTFNFYSDTLYLTCLFVGEPDEYIDDFIISFYAAVNTTKIDAVEHGIGLIREQANMMVSRIDTLGRSIPPARNVGQIAPFWRFGGSRPERMIQGDTLINYWLNMADRDEEDMSDPSTLRQAIRGARKMQGNPDAFGTGNIPDWIRLHLNEGLVAGPIRPQWPPIKHDNNGNVLCL